MAKVCLIVTAIFQNSFGWKVGNGSFRLLILIPNEE